MSLKCYQKDWDYKEHWATRYNEEQATKIMKKLLRHFKLGHIRFSFNTYKNGLASYGRSIHLPKKDISLGMICHEIGHQLAYKNRCKGHNKKAYKYIHRVYKWGERYIAEVLIDAYYFRRQQNETLAKIERKHNRRILYPVCDYCKLRMTSYTEKYNMKICNICNNILKTGEFRKDWL